MADSYITFPNIDPIIFSVGPISLRWYGLMYLIAFAAAWGLAVISRAVASMHIMCQISQTSKLPKGSN